MNIALYNIRRFASWILVAGDLLALFVFIFIGQSDHETINPVNPLPGLFAGTAQFAFPWLLASWLLGASSPTTRAADFFGRTLNAWLVAAPLGLLLRALILGRTTIPVAFMLVAAGLGGAFIFAWRLLLFILLRVTERSQTRAAS